MRHCVAIPDSSQESSNLSNLETHGSSFEAGGAPVPALDAQLAVKHVHVVVVAEELGQALLLLMIEKKERIKRIEKLAWRRGRGVAHEAGDAGSNPRIKALLTIAFSVSATPCECFD